MQWKLKQRSAFLSVTSALLVGGCSSGPAKPDAFCGPGGASTSGLVASGTGFTLTFGNLTAGANNDCPDPAAPAGVVSLTIFAHQTDGTGLVTLCVKRPDKLAGGLALDTDVEVVDANGTAGGCTFSIDRTTPPTGTASSTGECNGGTGQAGFALTVDGTMQLTRTCGATMDSVAATFQGTVAVAPQ
jgi:hypothetical protein